MAVVMFYLSRVVSDFPHFQVEHVGVEFPSYPDWYDSAVSREGLILGAFGEALEAEGGLYDIHHGHWSERLYVAGSPEASYLDGGVVEVHRWWGEWCSPRLDRIVSWSEFVEYVRERVW